MFQETLFVVAFKKVTTLIHEHIGLDDQEIFYFGFDDFHSDSNSELGMRNAE
jgi:hypothetical protein